jgi:uncharacterized membrane protein (UPF0127 family)
MLFLRHPAAFLVSALSLLLVNCGGTVATSDTYGTRLVKFPDGKEIRAEVMLHREDLVRGMKYRESLPEGRGMLFIHGKSGRYPYWMYEVKVPLDILWLDQNRSIVQLIHQVPPCPGPRERCPVYGGQFDALYVLEIPAGSAKKHGLRPGMILEF